MFLRGRTKVTRARFALAAWTAAAVVAALTACGGSSNAPAGSQRYYVPPTTAPLGQQETIQFSITIPPAAGGSGIRRHRESISSGAESASVTLAAVNGQPIPPQSSTIASVTPGAPNCVQGSNGNTCTFNVGGAVGVDAFTVVLYALPNGEGSVLDNGTVLASISSGDPNVVAVSLNPLVASIQLVLTPSVLKVGKSADGTASTQAIDASGAVILDYRGTVQVALSGAGNAVKFSHDPKNPQTDTVPVGVPAGFIYDGSPVFVQQLTITSTLLGSSPLLSTSAAIPFQFPATPTPSPTPTGLVPAIYALNAPGSGNTVTVYPISANGNAAPIRTLNLRAAKIPLSIAVDSGGQLRVGYADGTIDEFAYNATGNDKPRDTLLPTALTTPLPYEMAIGPSNELLTVGFTSLYQIPSGNFAALIYSSGESGKSDPLNAWNYGSGNPQIWYQGESGAYLAGLAMDDAGNFYVDGALRQSILSSVQGIYVAPSTATGPSVTPSRVIPGNSTTTIPAAPADGTVAGLALDSTGQIYETQFANELQNDALPGVLNIFAAGAAGGTTSVPPLTTITGAPLNIIPAQNALTLTVAVYGGQLYVANGSVNTIYAYTIPPPSGPISPPPIQTIAGSATGLNSPIGIALGLSGPKSP